MKKMIIPGTITESYQLGRAIRGAQEAGTDPVETILDQTGGWLLFRGELKEKTWSAESGYYEGYHKFMGVDEFKGHVYKVWFKNENHVTWHDGDVHVMSPDMICQVDSQTGEPVTNHQLEKGRTVALIGVQARALHRRDSILDKLAPCHYGFDIDYIPMEKRMASKER